MSKDSPTRDIQKYSGNTELAPGIQILRYPHSRDRMTGKIFKGVLDVQMGLTYMDQRTVLSLRFETSSQTSKAL
jgi:hypothetical protein